MCFTSHTVLCQEKIDCDFLGHVLEKYGYNVVRFYFFDTVYIYERDSIKHFTDCDLSNIDKERKYILVNEIPLNYNVDKSCIIFIFIRRVKKNIIEIALAPGRKDNTPNVMAMTILTYRKKYGKYKLIRHAVT